ncbi:MAG: MEMAR_RS02690 family S-layer glycoprotein [Methanoregula sp.]|nr:MEMAR_RS02690 family S-layer glycoprotein [Methanoregula sp.]
MTKRLTIALVAVVLFVLMAVMPVSAYMVAQNITNSGATVFIGESGLNLSVVQANAWVTTGSTNVASGDSQIGWWASAADITKTAPTKTISLVGRNTSFTVAQSDFVGYTGNWYFYNGTNTANPVKIFTVADPTLAIAPWDFSLASGNDMSGKSVVQGQKLGFKVDTNMYAAINEPLFRSPVAGSQGLPYNNDPTNTQLYGAITDGYIDIKVKDASGTTLTKLVNGSAPAQYANSITRQNVSYQPWYWGIAASTYNPEATTDTAYMSNWSTGALDRNGQYVYPPGTYTITAESWLNAMKDNYKNAGADYTGKTVSAATTITLVSDSIKIEANKESVVRSKAFSVTITGKPSTTYHLWVKGTSTMTGGYDSQPPMITQYQAGVAQDPYVAGTPAGNAFDIYAPGLAGNYSYQNGAKDNIWSDVANGGASNIAGSNKEKVGNGTYLYANVTTASTGVRTVEWQTTNWTKAQKYTIRVEQQFSGTASNIATYTDNANKYLYGTGTYFSDEVDVKVEKGAVTIVAAGDQSYYLGEEIKFSGTNTESYKTYMFIMGPNLQAKGSQINKDNPRAEPVKDMDATTFQQASVLGDNTWSWKWGTSKVALDAGTYTIYAVSGPREYSSTTLANVAFGTVSIIIKKPFVSATASQSTVAQGDKIFITGTAEGDPSGVMIWILGKNYPTNFAGVKLESVNADASFKYEVEQTTTKDLYPGQYFVVVQHPMQNNVFDVKPMEEGSNVVVRNMQLNVGDATAGTNIFTLLGAGSLQGSDAAEALVQGINSPNVDDTYTKLQFLVEVPVIRIDPIGDKHVGDKFTIIAATNLAVDDEVLVQVYSSSFKPTQKSQSGEFSGATGTVKVAKGDSGMNKISFDVDSSTFKPDEYIVTAEAILQTATGTALFNVLEGVTPVVTAVAPVTTVAPVVTTVAPVVTTVPPTPTPTQSPGYGALIALIGLGAVAFIVVRRH